MKDKSRKFVNSYFSGSGTNAVAALLQSFALTDEQIRELEEILEKILRCLLWVNPFLTVFQKQFRADMEDICDRVCIQGGGGMAHEYGLMLLKTLKLLRSGTEGTPPAATYVGEKEFADVKRRMEEIAGFRPYKKRLYAGMAATTALVIASILGGAYPFVWPVQ